MNNLINQFSDWWQGREPRERLLLTAAISVVVIAAFIKLVWQPLHEGTASAQQELQDKRALLAWMQAKQPELQRNRSNIPAPSSAGGQSLLSLMDRTLRAAQLKPATKRLQPDGDNAVKIWLEDADFNKLLRWLNKMEQQQGLNVVGFSSEGSDKDRRNGLVDAKLTLTRSE